MGCARPIFCSAHAQTFLCYPDSYSIRHIIPPNLTYCNRKIAESDDLPLSVQWTVAAGQGQPGERSRACVMTALAAPGAREAGAIRKMRGAGRISLEAQRRICYKGEWKDMYLVVGFSYFILRPTPGSLKEGGRIKS